MNDILVYILAAAAMAFGFYGWYFEDFKWSKRGIFYGTSEANPRMVGNFGLLDTSKSQKVWFGVLIGAVLLALVLDVTGAAEKEAMRNLEPGEDFPWWVNPWWLCIIFGTIVGAIETFVGRENKAEQEQFRQEQQIPKLLRIKKGVPLVNVLGYPGDYTIGGVRHYYYKMFPWFREIAESPEDAYERLEPQIVNFAHTFEALGFPTTMPD